MLMRQILSTLALLLALETAAAGVTFRFDKASTGSLSGQVKATMETNLTALLTEIHAAGTAGRDLNLSPISMEPNAKSRLKMLWENIHFTCEDDLVIQPCLKDSQGYQVRRVFVTVKPQNDTYIQGLDRELTISLSPSGVITGVRLALESQQDVSRVMSSGKSVTDMARREEILKWVEDFRSYYNEKNIASLRQIYSDDALIITGSVVTPRKLRDTGEMRLIYDDVIYKVSNKTEYLASLERCFARNERINVKFEHVSVSVSGYDTDVYGVKLKQTWHSSTYSDEGWLFLLWDFRDPLRPQIHVRTWQPGNMAEEETFAVGDFFIP